MNKRLTRESRAARLQFGIAGLLGTASAALTVAQAALLADVIARAAASHASLHDLRTPLVALTAVIILRALVAGGFELSGRLGAARVMSELRGRLAAALLVERPGRGPDERTGELATAAVQGVDALEAYFAGYLPALVLSVTLPVAVLAWIAPIDPLPAAILALSVPLLIVLMIVLGKRAQAHARQRWHTLSVLSSQFLDAVRGLETLRAYRRERTEGAALEQVGERYRSETMSTLRVAFLSALALELCAMAGMALVAIAVGIQLAGGSLTLRAGLTVALLAPELYGPLRAVGQQFHASADGLAAADRVFAVLDDAGSVARPAHPIEAPDPARAGLSFERVSYAYPGRPREVLRSLNLELAPGEHVALIGPSGAGKSTIAALALRLADPTAGRVRCGTVDLRAVDPKAWQRRIAWVPQRPTLFAGTLADNIALYDPGASHERIERAAHDANLDELVQALPEGLATKVGDGGRRLSAGQAQRIALARAFLADAPLVILDEPTAHLDVAGARIVAEAIERLADGRTLLVIAHDRELAARADRVIEIRTDRALQVRSGDHPMPVFREPAEAAA